MIPNKALAAIVAWIPRWPMPNSQLHTPTPRPSTFATMLQETPSSSVVDTILHTGDFTATRHRRGYTTLQLRPRRDMAEAHATMATPPTQTHIRSEQQQGHLSTSPAWLHTKPTATSPAKAQTPLHLSITAPPEANPGRHRRSKESLRSLAQPGPQPPRATAPPPGTPKAHGHQAGLDEKSRPDARRRIHQARPPRTAAPEPNHKQARSGPRTTPDPSARPQGHRRRDDSPLWRRLRALAALAPPLLPRKSVPRNLRRRPKQSTNAPAVARRAPPPP